MYNVFNDLGKNISDCVKDIRKSVKPVYNLGNSITTVAIYTLLITAGCEKKDSFYASQRPISKEMKNEMVNVSWKPNCPVCLDKLVYLEVAYYGFDGNVHHGELVVNKDVASEVKEIFKELFDKKFPIKKMKCIEHYNGSDEASMEDNNTSAFNCRMVTGGNRYSGHSYGTNIDINPVQNPYVKGVKVLPKSGTKFTDRSRNVKGMIKKGGPCYNAFTKKGWIWGGNWKTLKDYQHFQK